MTKKKKPASLQELINVTEAAIASGELTPDELAYAQENLKLVAGRSPAELESLDEFLRHMPDKESDLTVVILKGHLLIEQKVRQFIAERLLSPDALNDARLETHQAICLAQSLTLPNNMPIALWTTLKKINTLRNHVAHRLENPGTNDRVDDIMKNYAKEFTVGNGLVGVLAHAYGQLSELVRLAQDPAFRTFGKPTSPP